MEGPIFQNLEVSGISASALLTFVSDWYHHLLWWFIMKFKSLFSFLGATQLTALTIAVPPGFPASGNGLWFTSPGQVWASELLPVGNGYLAAMVPGGTNLDVAHLNIESLWSGGPFADPSYNGGNKLPSQATATHRAMDRIRQTIFSSPTGDIDNITELATDAGAYGSYVGAGRLVSTIHSTGPVSDYARWLDLDDGIARTRWTQSDITFIREVFCSHPTRACTHRIHSTTNVTLPDLTFAFSSALQPDLPTPDITCMDKDTLQVRGLAGTPGMLYEMLGKAFSTEGNITCDSIASPNATNATLTISGATDAWFTWVGDTDYSMDAGNAASGFSFKGADPHESLVQLIQVQNSSSSTNTSSPSYDDILNEHVQDYHETLTDVFSLSLGQTPQLDKPTNELKAAYQVDSGNTYLEWLTFNFGRYLLMSSARGALPANLQGKWATDTSNPWGADYHSNINIQMNYWSAEMSNLNVMQALFDYFEKTWAPRGAETAQVLYNISRGWTTHNEVNIFGHTGMKGGGNTAQWADYPESAVWMMIHVWDHFDYTNDVDWWKAQGWPLMKGVASFHLDKLIPDLHFNDSTLVTVPCNSPEQVPITLGCAHAQQMIWQMFNSIEKGFEASGDTDTAFLEEVRAKRAQMDKGLRIGSWGQLQEWKVEKDDPNDTHRHLSHLIGLYPGYAVTSYDVDAQGGLIVNGTKETYTKEQVLGAAKTSLIHRGNGTGPDADAGWEKAWRAAAWAQLKDADEFYHELTYTLERDFGGNLFSLYDPQDPDPIFQIDANLGYPGAVLNAILQAPDVPSFNSTLVITLLPALPKAWANGEIRGARIRGGMTLDMQWSDGKPTTTKFTVDANPIVSGRNVEVVFDGQTVGSFAATPSLTKNIQ
ncbi:glycoside hydrolase family 95 protein [Dendrothele bispora CBS 962.96]|uniref:Glycoside hydrolase family 95 protein n=1 Tax=Dendrothele bispora (strain CBS 962.96) TaxID=1314807 RepID=A0A4S8LMW0_DENBC|nr:glycoside hydrolase family 95 protein [Dendrothele bispora CBS 962.96]